MNADHILDGNGNLTDTYTDCLKEHEVIIDNYKYYLIKTFYGTNTRGDFLRTYSHYLDADLIDKTDVIPDQIEYNEYGVVYEQDLKVTAVFNLKFAHYSHDLKKIVFKEPEEILIAYHKGEFATNKSIDEQIHEKLDSCIGKVNNEIVSQISSLHPPPQPPGPPIRRETPQDEVLKELQNRFSNINKDERDEKKRRFMNHAIMYASAPPIKK